MPEEAYQQLQGPEGSLVAGGVDQVVDKILAQQQAVGSERFVGQIDIGGQPQADVLKGIELFATKVAPAVRKALG
jgi:alkanesulfonate monooxygenase SsuD/methylene tetrahydromethanopterin reductase-like flavin-dependent oxidoreductase (luciferase family)